MTCHRPHNVFDVVPADVVGSIILATTAATVQVPDSQPGSCHVHLICCCVLNLVPPFQTCPSGTSALLSTVRLCQPDICK